MQYASRYQKPRLVISVGHWILQLRLPGSDSLTGGRKFRTLNVVDDYNREALGIEVDYSLPSRRVIRLLDQLVEQSGKPERLKSLDASTYLHIDFYINKIR
jgi:putative transposase